MRLEAIFRTGLAAFLIISLAGCASTGHSPGLCAAIGAGVGAVGGGVGGGLYSANNTDRDHNEWEGAGIALASTAVGAGVGYLVCSLMEEEPKPEPRRATPPPEPKPAPPPPPPPEKPTACTGLVRLENVNFANNKSDINAKAAASLDETVRVLQGCPEHRVRLDAYTDSVGSDKYNQALSQRRADSVRTYLISHGIAASRIEAKGFGEANPVADNATAEGRAENRRVELEPIE
ncbi:MAG TPA: OmpA family protein [Myxococcota bacterium]|nr:OmpA family protein [Myxococcota bacterium]